MRIGEIIEANTTGFVAGTYELHAAPPFGALVRVEGRDGYAAYGLVYNIETTSREMAGRAVVRGRDGMFDEDIYLGNPDLTAVLQTEFHAVIVGFCQDDVIRQHLPPLPPPTHYSVFLCDGDELCRFTQRLLFCRTILNTPNLPHEELLPAVLRQASRHWPDPGAFLVNAGRTLALLLRDEHPRLLAILERMRP